MTPLIATVMPEPVWVLCKRLKVKLTFPRRMVMNLLDAADKPLDAIAIYDCLDETPHRVHRATLYRTLQYLEEKGAIIAYPADRRRRVFQRHGGPPFVELVDPITQEPIACDLAGFPQALCAWIREQGFELRGYVELQPIAGLQAQPWARSNVKIEDFERREAS